MKRKKKRRTKIGSSLLLLAGALCVGAGLPPPAEAAAKHVRPGEQVLVAGTVFRDPGFALPGAEVTVSSVTPPDSRQKPRKWKAISDNRGEFAIRVPPGAVQYTITVTCKGFGSAEKTVSVEGQDRADVTFLLEPEPKR